MQVGGRLIRSEVGGGGALFLSALLAIICANSMFSPDYFAFVQAYDSFEL